MRALSFLITTYIAIRAADFASPSFQEARCPCNQENSTLLNLQSDNYGVSFKFRLCIGKVDNVTLNINLIQKSLSSSIKLSQIQSVMEENSCDAIVRISRRSRLPKRIYCPGVCKPIPTIRMPISWLQHFPQDGQISCSSDGEMYANFRQGRGQTNILEHLFWRRIQECYEKSEWAAIIDPMFTKPRKVSTVVIWNGISIRNDIMKQQSRVLNNYTMTGSQAVIGWLADETLYPCLPNTLICPYRSMYMPLMPLTELSSQSNRNKHWRCAQRMLLRALSHVLTLYDPDMVIIGDGDTYINYPLIESVLHKYILKKFAVEPIVLGK